MVTKFAGRYFPDDITLEELAKQLETESGFIVRYKKEEVKEPTAQEILNGI